MQARKRISVFGIVQGVGFRPHVYRLAHRYGLSGHVRNTDSGVTIEVQGPDATLGSFLESLASDAPPLARIASLSVDDLSCLPDTEFTILASESGKHSNTLIAPDVATCADCLGELLDPADRRYGYPFINCTNCGPRFTILKRIPYDRPNTSMTAFRMCPSFGGLAAVSYAGPNTSMTAFRMCPACQAEYDDPFNRRFHAQPNGCWECGPQLALRDVEGNAVTGDPLSGAIKFLKEGRIGAIKGLGGFHLAIDATNATAVDELRRRKRRFEKPLALMVADVHGAEALCVVSEEDRVLLESSQRPIVLMRTRAGSMLPGAIAPGNPDRGVFLPYTPVHHLLFASGSFAALVMTSANVSEEPICIDNDEAVERLRGIADFFLVHNREILLRCDDSVVRNTVRRTQILRRSRGFVPVPVTLDRERPPVLAVGGELKNAVCLTRGKQAFMGQHIGDLENLATYNFFLESIAHLQDILESKPVAIAHDVHPGYLSTQWALEQEGAQTIAIQHHHAHVASCMAENHLSGPAIGVVLDGTGYGTDGQVWGGEVLIADFRGFRRAAHLEYVPMPGGAQAIREPWRMTVAHLLHADGSCFEEGLPFLASIATSQIEVVRRMTEQRIRSPLTSSCGRLFDAVAALIGLRTSVNFEAQSAIELEACWRKNTEEADEYRFAIKGGDCIEIGTGLLFEQILNDLSRGISQQTISRRFHQGLMTTIADVVYRISQATGIRYICLSGGCFLNAHLARGLDRLLRAKRLLVYMQSQVPCGDGGLSLGQAAIAAYAVEQDAVLSHLIEPLGRATTPYEIYR